MNETFMRKLTVMVVDSEGELSFEIDSMLMQRVKAVHYIKDPAEAIRDFNSIMPQLVVIDLKLAIMDIVDFSSKIKNLNPECEIIVILGFIEPHKLIEMVNMGIYRFVLKPISVPKLSEALTKSIDTLMDRALSFQSKYMQEILNAEDNPVFETDGVSIFKANKAFMECFGAKTIKQFSQTYPDLSSIFVMDEQAKLSKGWLRDFILNGEEPKALVYDNRRGEKREFYLELGVSEVTKDHFIVTMTDITEIEKSFNRKIEMLSSQINSKEKIKFRSMLEFEIARCKRYKKTFSLVLVNFDVDSGEDIEAWEKIFKVMRHTLRSSDLFAKVDKNQLAVIATETPRQGAARMLERLQAELDKLAKDGLQVRFKGGAVEYSVDDSVQTLFKKAVSTL